jgi:sarcosine oxidase subunit alpha
MKSRTNRWLSQGRLTEHPILKFKRGRKVRIYFEDRETEAYEGESVAAALIASGVKVFRHSKRHKRPRGLFCAIGKCSSCLMEIDGVPNQMTCTVLVRDGMRVKRDRTTFQPQIAQIINR